MINEMVKIVNENLPSQNLPSHSKQQEEEEEEDEEEQDDENLSQNSYIFINLAGRFDFSKSPKDRLKNIK